MEKPSIKKNFLLSTMYQVFLLIMPFITAPYTSRVLGVEKIGTFSYIQSVQSYFLLFAALGTASYGKREIARNRDDKEKRSRIFWEIELLSIITTFTVLIVWFVWICINSQYRLFYFIMSLNLISVALDISWMYIGLERMANVVFFNAVFRVIGITSIFIFVKESSDLWIYILILAAMTFCSNIGMWICLPKYINFVRIQWKNIAKHFKETLIYFIPTIATSIYTVLDKTLIGLITHSASQNGYYEQTVKIIHMSKTITFTSLNSIMGARIAFLFAKGENEEIKERIKVSIDYILFMGVGICFGIWAVADTFVPVFFGKGYDYVALLLKVFCPIIVIIGVSNCLGSHYYTPAGLRTTSSKYLIYGSIVNLCLNLVLIPRYESLGAVIASVLAELTITVLYLKNCNGYLYLEDLIKKIWKKLIAGSVMLLVITIITPHLGGAVIDVLIEIMVGIVVYVIMLFLLKDSLVMLGVEMIKRYIKK